jgi:hypothetical protein
VVTNSKTSTLVELQYTRNTNESKIFFFLFFTGVTAEDGQWLPYRLLVMEQHQAAQMSR